MAGSDYFSSIHYGTWQSNFKSKLIFGWIELYEPHSSVDHHRLLKKWYIIQLIPTVLPSRSLSSHPFTNIEGTGDDSAAESEYVSGFCIERKIDLTNHIKWWGSNKNRQSDAGTRLSEEKKHGFAGDIYSELKTLEQKVQPTEPYKMPELGRLHNDKKHKSSSMSALSILSHSAAYKSLQEKVTKKPENSAGNDENENKNTVNELDHGKAVEKSSNHEGGNDRLDIAMGMSGALSLQRNVYPLTPFLSAPLLTAYNTVDPLVDPVLWTSLVPMLPAGLSRTAEVGIIT